MEVKTVTLLEEGYPESLRNIPNPPEILYYMGDLSLTKAPCVAMVGARECTEYGRWVAHTFSRYFGERGVVVVSGLARGIDSYSHRGTLDGGGKTIAVLGYGFQCCVPSRSRQLLQDICKDGLVLTEYPPGYPGGKHTFPARNRIISGLCAATVVVEAGVFSGSLITAGLAADQGKDVYAVPGNVTSLYSAGTNKLICDGAIPLTVPEDLICYLGIESKETVKNRVPLGGDEEKIMKILQKSGEITAAKLCEETKIEAGKINGLITILEIKGMIYTAMGKIFIAK